MYARKTPKFEIGDKIAYSVQFLASIGMRHGEMAHARGIITGFYPLSSQTMLAEIRWNKGDCPGRVNTFNLAKVGANSRFCNVD
jgi:hypothetical protein